MKKCSKIISAILALLMIFSVASVAVSAADEVDLNDIKQSYIDLLNRQNIEYENDAEIKIRYFLTENNWNVFLVDLAVYDKEVIAEQIGSYIFNNNRSYSPYKLGIYAENNGVVLTLKEAYDNGEIELDNLYDWFNSSWSKALYIPLPIICKDDNPVLAAFIKYNFEKSTPRECFTQGRIVAASIGKIDDWTIFSGDLLVGGPMECAVRIDKYIFTNHWYAVPYDLGIYVLKDGKVYTLEEAYKTGEIDIDAAAKKCKGVYSAGDTNLDGKVDLIDIVNVQKNIARLISVGTTYKEGKVYDYNGDHKIDLEDVVQMQKFLARIISGPVMGN
ncbi:hypothetical protein AGMMS50284_5860 [Clostridia bacterium]|nr:hypothetical protein AGMMS50284_5860 [Clostridia bacterium]